MDTLLFKVLATPLLIGMVTLAGRRWGPAISGLLVGLPLTSGPVALFLALENGTHFAASAAVGISAGGISVAAFCLTYSWLAFRLPWWACLGLGWLAFASVTALLLGAGALPALVVALAVYLSLVLALRLMPRTTYTATKTLSPWWDLPARMVLATAFVLLLTGLAAQLGPHLSGLLAPFPIFISILSSFSQRLQGPQAVVSLLRGATFGLFGFASFFVVIALAIVPLGIVPAFVLASATALGLQALSFSYLHGRAVRVRLASMRLARQQHANARLPGS